MSSLCLSLDRVLDSLKNNFRLQRSRRGSKRLYGVEGVSFEGVASFFEASALIFPLIGRIRLLERIAHASEATAAASAARAAEIVACEIAFPIVVIDSLNPSP